MRTNAAQSVAKRAVRSAIAEMTGSLKGTFNLDEGCRKHDFSSLRSRFPTTGPFIGGFRANSRAAKLGQQLRCLFGEVGDDEVCSGTPHPDEGFKDGAIFVEPAFFDGGLQHRVLS